MMNTESNFTPAAAASAVTWATDRFRSGASGDEILTEAVARGFDSQERRALIEALGLELVNGRWVGPEMAEAARQKSGRPAATAQTSTPVPPATTQPTAPMVDWGAVIRQADAETQQADLAATVARIMVAGKPKAPILDATEIYARRAAAARGTDVVEHWPLLQASVTTHTTPEDIYRSRAAQVEQARQATAPVKVERHVRPNADAIYAARRRNVEDSRRGD